MPRPWCSRHGDELRIAVHVQPNASRSEVAGEIDGALKIRLHAPPVDGKANEVLERFIAERLGLARRAVSVAHGHTSRHKLLALQTDLETDEVRIRLLA
jgi:uncharacterized protein (TIGR00251 family)